MIVGIGFLITGPLSVVDRREDYPQPRAGEATHGHARVESFADVALGG